MIWHFNKKLNVSLSFLAFLVVKLVTAYYWACSRLAFGFLWINLREIYIATSQLWWPTLNPASKWILWHLTLHPDISIFFSGWFQKTDHFEFFWVINRCPIQKKNNCESGFHSVIFQWLSLEKIECLLYETWLDIYCPDSKTWYF